MLLDGRQLAGFIKERHKHAVAGMSHKPKMVIVQPGDAPATHAYVRAKRRYGEDIGVEVEVLRPEGDISTLRELVTKLNDDDGVDGLIVQLPLPDPSITEEAIRLVASEKDIDGLVKGTLFDPPTPLGILWLLSGYNVEYKGKTVAVVGMGRLVGAPLARMLEDSGAHVIGCDRKTEDLKTETLKADIIVTATGQPGLITADMVKPGAALVDAGGGYKDGKIISEFDPALREDESMKITPNPGGVGPMTVSALFDNLLQAASKKVS